MAEEYYYDLYCLEADVENDEPKKVDNRNCGGDGESGYLQLKDRTSSINTTTSLTWSTHKPI